MQKTIKASIAAILVNEDTVAILTALQAGPMPTRNFLHVPLVTLAEQGLVRIGRKTRLTRKGERIAALASGVLTKAVARIQFYFVRAVAAYYAGDRSMADGYIRRALQIVEARSHARGNR